ncbi:hypothetical protein ACN47E_005755 [Coniothyrium glycines]
MSARGRGRGYREGSPRDGAHGQRGRRRVKSPDAMPAMLGTRGAANDVSAAHSPRGLLRVRNNRGSDLQAVTSRHSSAPNPFCRPREEKSNDCSPEQQTPNALAKQPGSTSINANVGGKMHGSLIEDVRKQQVPSSSPNMHGKYVENTPNSTSIAVMRKSPLAASGSATFMVTGNGLAQSSESGSNLSCESNRNSPTKMNQGTASSAVARRMQSSGTCDSITAQQVEDGQKQRQPERAVESSEDAPARPAPTLMDILTGPGVKIVVGTALAFPHCTTNTTSWSLPQALVSNHSKLLAEVCSRPLHKETEARIVLPEHDPWTFSLFVEWMYLGTMKGQSRIPKVHVPDVASDIKAWILGNKLHAFKFQNFCMRLIYRKRIDEPLKRMTWPQSVEYVCDNAVTGSKIREFFVDYVAMHFSDRSRLGGTTEKWDKVLEKHPELRLRLFHRLRADDYEQDIVKPVESYLITEQEAEAIEALASVKHDFVPMKRGANGEAVKRETIDN